MRIEEVLAPAVHGANPAPSTASADQDVYQLLSYINAGATRSCQLLEPDEHELVALVGDWSKLPHPYNPSMSMRYAIRTLNFKLGLCQAEAAGTG